MPMTNFPYGFAAGLSVRGLPLLQTHPGNIYWVNNSATFGDGQLVGGSDGNKGTFQRPFATLDFAVGSCKASAGDIIFVKPGHAETISNATTLLLDVAGIAVIGLGVGSLRPTFTFDTGTNANIPIKAANISLQNLLFVANFAAIASVFTATGTTTPTDFSVENCSFHDKTNVLNFVSIITGNATANSMDGLRFVRNRIKSLGTTAATTAIKLASATDRVSIIGNFGVWAVLNDTACVLAAGANQVTSFDFGDNVFSKPNTSSTGGSFISGSGNAWTGHCYNNCMHQCDASAGIWIAVGHGTGLGFSNNLSPIVGAGADISGSVNPAAA